ncbi:MAG: prolyl oligopeptidase family serine peptidase [Phycisphaerae bacterium]|jgi:predicted peptidase
MNLNVLVVASILSVNTAQSTTPAAAADQNAGIPMPPFPTGFLFRTLPADSAAGIAAEMKYVVYVPRDYDPGTSWPVILFLHGRGECGHDGQKQVAQGIGTSLLWNADRWPFIVILPQKPDEQAAWEQYDDALMRIIELAAREYRIDRDRIALTGLSQGGHGVWALAARRPDAWSALVPICGYARSFEPREIAARIRHIPTWAFHGDADDVVPPQETQAIVEALRAAGGAPRLTVYPGVNHNSWDRAYADPELPRWLLAQRRPSGAVTTQP